MTTPRFLPLIVIALLLTACTANRVTRPGAGAEVAWFTDATTTSAPEGVFDRTDVLIAYHQSEFHAAKLRELIRQRDAARAAGDAARAEELEQQGAAMQSHSHRQLAGAESLDNIAADLRHILPDIAREAGVSRIVERGGETPGRPTIDITHAIIARLLPRQN